MKSFFLSLFVLLSLTYVSTTNAASPTTTVANDRFGLSVTYRQDLFGIARDTSADGSGAAAVSPSGKAGFYIQGSFAFQTLEQSYYAALATPGRTVTYKTINPTEGFFVVSGLEGSKIYYVKTFVLDGLEKSLGIWYDSSLKAIYDRETVAMSLYGFNPRLPADP